MSAYSIIGPPLGGWNPPPTLGDAQEYMAMVIDDLRERGRIPQWRYLALQQLCEDMPNAGMIFSDDAGTHYGVRKC